MKKHTFILFLIISQLIIAQNKLPFKLIKDWELKGLQNPESVVLDTKNKVLYISNVNGKATDKDANGYISKVSLNGKMLEQKWIIGLNAPKGLVIYKDKLYTTDIDEIVEINIKTKQQLKIKANGATFLNDITADKKGNIYASNTFGFSAIYKLSSKNPKTVKLFIKDEKLQMPNGLHISKNNLFVAGWGKDFNSKTYETKILGSLLKINLKSKKIETVSIPTGNLDGLSQTIHGFLLTDWLAGKLHYYSNKTSVVTNVLNLPKGSADTYFDKKTKAVFIPLMLDNKLLKYHFIK
ncbi:hypothetical protein N9901_01275 [Flavobacteriaceae bacterium]|nr:hypothetical protein [Flavobacteriaceae bacterium]